MGITRRSRVITGVLALLAGTFLPAAAHAAPRLSLVRSGTTLSAFVTSATASVLLDLRANTDGNAISGLQGYLVTSPAQAATYGATPVTATNSPFTASDVFQAPATGAVVRQSGGTTVLFKSSAGDYPAFADNAILTFQINTSLLTAGTYTFTPVGEELTNATTTITSFATPGSFTLTIIPEPATAGVLATGGAGLLLARRRRRAAVAA
jgi:hypothetical protein